MKWEPEKKTRFTSLFFLPAFGRCRPSVSAHMANRIRCSSNITIADHFPSKTFSFKHHLTGEAWPACRAIDITVRGKVCYTHFLMEHLERSGKNCFEDVRVNLFACSRANFWRCTLTPGDFSTKKNILLFVLLWKSFLSYKKLVSIFGILIFEKNRLWVTVCF